MLPTCYRHPDRETRLACSNCERPVCVDCVRTAAVGQRCLECAAPAPGAGVMDMEDVRRRSTRPALVTFTALGISVAVFALELLVPGFSGIVRALGEQSNVAVAEGQWWRLFSAAFLHGGITHIAFNMYALYLFGPQLEREVGSLPFAGLYLASALAGGAAFYAAEPFATAVGASGAIFGLFGAWLAASYRGRHTEQGRASLRSLLVLLAINAVIGFTPGLNIAWQAHAGGLVAGFVIAFVWSLAPFRRQTALRTAFALAVAVVALATVL